MLEKLNFKEIASATMVLFAVIDIVGSIPIIIKIKKRIGEIQAFKITYVSAAIMIAFLWGGERILGFIGIGINEFAVAGALVIFCLALEMTLGIEVFKHTTTGKKSKAESIVPLAFPIIAGAGSMTSIISLRAEFASVNILIAILINLLVVYVVLKLTKKLEKIIGQGGIAILEKVFGVILLAIAIKLFITNVKFLFA